MINDITRLPGTVFVIDDDPNIHGLYAAILKRANLNAHSIFDAHDAINELAGVVPDLIVLDIYMPDIDGFVILSAIRQYEHLNNTPVVMITAHDNLQARCEGANGYILKPFTIDQIDNMLAEWALV